MENGGSGDFFKGLIIGSLLGSIIALMYAPKSGKETREELHKKADEFAAKAKEDYETTLEKSKKTFKTAMERLKELEQIAKKKVEDVEEQVHDITEKSKGTIEESKSRVRRAVDAGVQAFKEEKDTKKEKKS